MHRPPHNREHGHATPDTEEIRGSLKTGGHLPLSQRPVPQAEVSSSYLGMLATLQMAKLGLRR